MRKTYLVDKFSLDMLGEFPVNVTIDKIDKEEFCLKVDIESEDGMLINAVGHDSTVKLINTLCETQLQKNSKVGVKMNEGDVALIIMVTERLPEVNKEEIMRMVSEGKISFYEVIND